MYMDLLNQAEKLSNEFNRTISIMILCHDNKLFVQSNLYYLS